MRHEDTLRQEWQTFVDLGIAIPGGGFAALSEELQAAGPWPPDLNDAPMIIDTDIGGDGDDALAVATAARSVSALAAVITSDEKPDGGRARFARLLLDNLERSDVITVSGANLGNSRYYVVDSLVPDSIPAQRTDVLDVVREVCERTSGPVRWVGMAPLTNLAWVVSEEPKLAARLHVTQMGGALAYRDPNRAEHNIRLDVAAARRVLEAVQLGLLATPSFVASDVTFTPDIEITRNHAIYQHLDTSREPWAKLLTQHLNLWFDQFHPGTMQHDALTLAVALDLPFVDLDIAHIVMDAIGRTTTSTKGAAIRWSNSAEYGSFMTWLAHALNPENPQREASPWV